MRPLLCFILFSFYNFFFLFCIHRTSLESVKFVYIDDTHFNIMKNLLKPKNKSNSQLDL
jgi:hypothetical protein